MNNEVKIVFQPIFEAKTMKIFAYEGLSRFKDTNITEIISKCSTNSDFYEIEKMTFFETLKEYKIRNFKELLFINSFPNTHLNQADLLKIINNYKKILRKTIVEILEYPELDVEIMKKKKTEMNGYIADFAIDDYGINSFENFLVIKPKYLKIDRSIINGICKDANKQDQLDEIINLAKNFSCLTIAEGIEMVEDFTYLRKRDIDYYQGFLLGKPE
jgi:EAL domain-containing protein (putative c-di-GMP-specific phosphodiesterase class I)